MQETLIKSNLVHWTGLGLILGKALASVHPEEAGGSQCRRDRNDGCVWWYWEYLRGTSNFELSDDWNEVWEKKNEFYGVSGDQEQSIRFWEVSEDHWSTPT